MNRKRGDKFTEKYKVESATIYKADPGPEVLKIPQLGHVLFDRTAPLTFDPVRVEAIDRDGKMTTPIEVWTDPDTGVMWVLDGRGRLLDVREVNRRRAAEGREPVKPLLVPFNGDEKAAVLRVREKNYHRRTLRLSDMAVDLLALRAAGHSWEACAAGLHVATDDAEKWGRELIPLAHCIPEVQEAVNNGRLKLREAKRYGGKDLEGLDKLSRRDQLDKLNERLAPAEPKKARPRVLSPQARERVEAALTNGETAKLTARDKEHARLVAATLARVGGDAHALDAWPEVAAIFETAAEAKAAPGRPKKSSGE